ncbi:ParA family protein [Runella sp. MFBS21]|uniref:ParA family protein n=1 Tax=Runella sp. MFBS21 TaxID=3034018 RepID=UPI0023F7261C|nr:ParA family protein [Runella sp. MFBS21]MCA0233177.1 ParA family protein [Bacteroidota bacterium]MDF7821185.1 ParA family protein [Runella sp. MFBS21]
MKVITVAHQKGGVGKTTLALNLSFLFKDTLKVGILDTDLQGSVVGLGELLEGVTLVPREALETGEVPELDILIIDTPPYLTDQLSTLFEVSDFVLVPTKVSYLDVMAIKATIALIAEAQKKNPDMKAGIVLNMVKYRTSVNADIKGILDSYSIPTLKTKVMERVSYIRSVVANGVGNIEDEKAREEMMALAEEIVEQL